MRVRLFKCFFAFCALGLAASGMAHAAPLLDTAYDPDIPTLESVAGHESGAEVSSVGEIQDYFRALSEAAPDRMRIVKYAESWQGRDLNYAVISSPENMRRTEDVKAAMSRLAAGQGLSRGDLDAIASELPAVVWLSYGVHGDEISPPDSGTYLAYHLLAARNDPLVEQILDDVIVIVDPSQNPDGRDRFVHSFYSSLGLEPLADRNTAEHDQPWPGGRYNHYLFDLNRDWFALTQPETQGKVAAVLDWHPVVYVDAHEMGGDSSYYFPPASVPYNPNIPEEQKARLEEMGRNHARWFDQNGLAYFTREVFDAFYPGYGDMWPMLNGATAMTFEQASARGLVFERRDGDLLTYRDGVRNNVLTSLSTLEVVSRDKAGYLKAYAGYRAGAIEAGEDSRERFIVIDRSERTYEAEALVRRLASQDIRVHRLDAGSEACGSDYPQGGFVVDLAQPQGRLARTLLLNDTALPEDFVEEQEALRARGGRPALYDVTAWSVPLMDGVEAEVCRSVRMRNLVEVRSDEPIPARIGSRSSAFGLVVPWSDGGQARLVIAALQAGLVGRTTDEPFTQDGREFPRGSVVFAAGDNEEGFRETLTALARDIGAEIAGMPSSWVSDGPNFGSSSFLKLKTPRVAMAWGEGTSATSAGNTRFVIERQLGLPVSPIRVSALSGADLSRYDVLILPESGWGGGGALGRAGPALTEFVEEGGVLVAFGSSISAVSSKEVALLASKPEKAASEEEGGDKSDEEDRRAPGTILESEADYKSMITDHDASPDYVPGVIARAVADPDHWLASGYEEANALVSGASIYQPLNEADGVNVFRFADAGSLLRGGYLWDENREQLAYKPFVMAQTHGDGMTIGFTQSPTTRAYLNGLNLLLANALVLAPARVSN